MSECEGIGRFSESAGRFRFSREPDRIFDSLVAGEQGLSVLGFAASGIGDRENGGGFRGSCWSGCQRGGGVGFEACSHGGKRSFQLSSYRLVEFGEADAEEQLDIEFRDGFVAAAFDELPIAVAETGISEMRVLCK